MRLPSVPIVERNERTLNPESFHFLILQVIILTQIDCIEMGMRGKFRVCKLDTIGKNLSIK